MIFLLVYDTTRAELVTIEDYADNEKDQALKAFRAKQEALLRELGHIEVALFEADSRKTLERTHSRYFRSLEQLNAKLGHAKKSA